MRTKPRPLNPLGAGLGVILVAIGVTVAVTPAQPQLPAEQVLAAHESGLYFLEGESMAKRLLPDPQAHWSKLILDPKTDCRRAGHGIWYAGGLVSQPTSDGSRQISPWRVLFVPGSGAPLYARVGEIESGDLNAALQSAGLPPREPDAGAANSSGDQGP